MAELPPAVAAQNRGPTILATISAVTAISTVFAIGRVYVRSMIMKKMHYDDYLVIFSVVSLHLMCTVYPTNFWKR